MHATKLSIPDVLLLKPQVFNDNRGFFLEGFNQNRFGTLVGRDVGFVQDNHSCSSKNVLRGLHYQRPRPQGKLLRVVVGDVFHVAVDLRRSSPTFARWTSAVITAKDKNMLWVPAGLAHGFLVLSDSAEVLYKTTDYWAPEHEHCIVWDDPDLDILWPIQTKPLLSKKDEKGTLFKNAELFDSADLSEAR